MQQDNDPKHRSKSTTEWLQQKKISLLEWPRQSPDLNSNEMLWHDLKRAVHIRHPKNIAELKPFCEEEWSKMSSDRCAGLIRNYRKRLVGFIVAKGCDCLHGVFNKDIKTCNCLCVISLSRLCLSIVVI
uniref:Tc1-like transposase DDE domain-containing protein n=1 Tax=Oncorhynchus tshawytscha TaxID=74940 RepID=A0AAZ3NRU8_ONCTS